MSSTRPLTIVAVPSSQRGTGPLELLKAFWNGFPRTRRPMPGSPGWLVDIAPEERPGCQVDGHHAAGAGGTDQDAVAVRRRNAGQAANRILRDVRLDHGQLLRPKQVPRSPIQGQESDFVLDLGHHVELAAERQRRAEEKSVARLQRILAAQLPLQLAGAWMS